MTTWWWIRWSPGARCTPRRSYRDSWRCWRCTGRSRSWGNRMWSARHMMKRSRACRGHSLHGRIRRLYWWGPRSMIPGNSRYWWLWSSLHGRSWPWRELIWHSRPRKRRSSAHGRTRMHQASRLSSRRRILNT